MKITVPVGARFCDPVIVAVKLTVEPSAAGEGDATSVVVEFRGWPPDAWTYCANAADVLGGIVALPRYRAVIGWPPAASPFVVSRAAVPESATVAILVLPS